MNRFWRNVTPNLILEVAYPDRRAPAFTPPEIVPDGPRER